MILVVGGAGYLGSHVANLLGARALVYDTLLYADEYRKPVDFVRADVTDYATLQPYLDRASTVIWLAALVGDAACMLDPARALATNQEAVAYLADHYDGPIIFTSTCSVYGCNEDCVDERAELYPQSIYAETKVVAERALAGKNALILRLGTLHGVSDRMRFDLVVNVMTLHAVTKGQIKVYGGAQFRPLLAVQDAAELIVRMVGANWTRGVYNVAGANYVMRFVARMVAEMVPGTTVEVVESAHEDRRNYHVNCEKAHLALGYSVVRSVQDSIQDVALLVASGRLKHPFGARYVNSRALERT